MTKPWVWQNKDWPHFNYKSINPEKEMRFIKHSGFIAGSLLYLNEPESKQFYLEILCNEALKTSEIEGELLDRNSVQSSLLRHFSLKKDQKKDSPYESNIAEMMYFLYESYQKKLSHRYLLELHHILMKNRRAIRAGSYRTHHEPMQIVSGAMGREQIHYEAPPSKAIKEEMTVFIDWFNKTAPTGKTPLSCLTRASIAHLYFEMIHPFEDGNGRIGRALVKKIISQHIGSPTMLSLSHILFSNQKSYYQQLAAYNHHLTITGWIDYFSDMIFQAQDYSLKLSKLVIEKTKLFTKYSLNPRQEKVLKRLFKEGLEGFKGGLSAENYIKISKTSRATATRDLQELCTLGILKRIGEKKHTRYYLSCLEPLSLNEYL